MSKEFQLSFQPEQIMLAQKDTSYQYTIYSKIIDLMEYLHPEIVNYKVVQKLKSEIKLVSMLLYYALTSFRNIRTLGEEYTNLRQLCPNDFDFFGVPVRKNRVLIFIASLCFGPYIVEKLGSYFDRLKTNSNTQSFLQVIPFSSILVKKAIDLHLAIFFIHGLYYQISKRISGICHIYTRQPPTHGIVYKNIGRFLLLQLSMQLIVFLIGLRRYKSKKANQEKPYELVSIQQEQLTCALCFDIATSISSTPCGHIFCWDCTQKCPQCRQHCKANKIVRLINFY